MYNQESRGYNGKQNMPLKQEITLANGNAGYVCNVLRRYIHQMTASYCSVVALVGQCCTTILSFNLS